jgi:heme A synthase
MLRRTLTIKKVYIITNLFLTVVYLGLQVGLLRAEVEAVFALGPFPPTGWPPLTSIGKDAYILTAS